MCYVYRRQYQVVLGYTLESGVAGVVKEYQVAESGMRGESQRLVPQAARRCITSYVVSCSKIPAGSAAALTLLRSRARPAACYPTPGTPPTPCQRAKTSRLYELKSTIVPQKRLLGVDIAAESPSQSQSCEVQSSHLRCAQLVHPLHSSY